LYGTITTLHIYAERLNKQQKWLFRLRGVDPDGDQLSFGILGRGSDLVSIRQASDTEADLFLVRNSQNRNLILGTNPLHTIRVLDKIISCGITANEAKLLLLFREKMEGFSLCQPHRETANFEMFIIPTSTGASLVSRFLKMKSTNLDKHPTL
jgi:hypothetical protein